MVASLNCQLAPRLASANERAKRPADRTSCESTPACLRPFLRATAHYDAGRLDAAIGEYETAYAAVPVPVCLYYIARSQEQLGRREAALALYLRYITEAGDHDPETVSKAKQHIAELSRARAPLSKDGLGLNSPLTAAHFVPPDAARPAKKVPTWAWALIGIGVAGGISGIFAAALWPRTPRDAIPLN